MENTFRTTTEQLGEAARALATHRGRPCILLVVPTIARPAVLALRAVLAGVEGDVDLVLSSGGGNIDAAYLMARDLRRRGRALTVYVPVLAKSAATLIGLVADDLVLGPLGELGPLDEQCQESRRADFPADTSRLVPFKAFEQLRHTTLQYYDDAAKRVVEGSGMRPFDACGKAAELTSALFGPIFAQIDPIRLAESARGLEVASAYACRLLRRHRPETHDEACRAVERLIHAYPSHGFVIDLEELHELGLPARAPSEGERPAMEALEAALLAHADAGDVIEAIDPAGPAAEEHAAA